MGFPGANYLAVDSVIVSNLKLLIKKLSSGENSIIKFDIEITRNALTIQVSSSETDKSLFNPRMYFCRINSIRSENQYPEFLIHYLLKLILSIPCSLKKFLSCEFASEWKLLGRVRNDVIWNQSSKRYSSTRIFTLHKLCMAVKCVAEK